MPKTSENIVPTRTYSLSLWALVSSWPAGNLNMDLAAMIRPRAVYLLKMTNMIASSLSLNPVVMPI